MVASTSRRRFIQAVGGGAVGLLGFFYPGLTEVTRARANIEVATVKPGLQANGSTVIPAEGADPTYAGGEVTDIAGDAVILTSASSVRRVLIGPEVAVWKEVVGSADLINTGDWVDVKGTPQSDGSLLATSGMVFVNIGRLDGVLLSTAGNTITVSAYGMERSVELSPTLEAVHKEDGSPYAGGVGSVPVGTPLGAVGLLVPNGGFRATRIWI